MVLVKVRRAKSSAGKALTLRRVSEVGDWVAGGASQSKRRDTRD